MDERGAGTMPAPAGHPGGSGGNGTAGHGPRSRPAPSGARSTRSRSMFSKDLEFTIGQCYKQAREARHEFMTVEHLLLALLDNDSASGVLRACGADLERLSGDLRSIIAETVPLLAGGDARDTQPTPGRCGGTAGGGSHRLLPCFCVASVL